MRSSIVVEAPIERAFAVFTNDFSSFKPPEHNMLQVDIAETVFEPRVGGSLYDRGADGSECRWARVLAYEPPHRVLFSWDISPQWLLDFEGQGIGKILVPLAVRREAAKEMPDNLRKLKERLETAA